MLLLIFFSVAAQFCEWDQVGIEGYIPCQKYQVKLHSSPWFSGAFAAVIAHRNNFLRLNQQDISSRDVNSVASKGKSATPSLFNGTEAFVFCDITKIVAENFYKNFNLDDSGISLSAFPSYSCN